MMTPSVYRLMCECGMYYLALDGATACYVCTYLAKQIERENKRMTALDPELRARRRAAKIEEWRQTHRERYLEAKRIRAATKRAAQEAA